MFIGLLACGQLRLCPTSQPYTQALISKCSLPKVKPPHPVLLVFLVPQNQVAHETLATLHLLVCSLPHTSDELFPSELRVSLSGHKELVQGLFPCSIAIPQLDRYRGSSHESGSGTNETHLHHKSRNGSLRKRSLPLDYQPQSIETAHTPWLVGRSTRNQMQILPELIPS